MGRKPEPRDYKMASKLHQLWQDTVRGTDPKNKYRVYYKQGGSTLWAVVGASDEDDARKQVRRALPTTAAIEQVTEFSEGSIQLPRETSYGVPS